MRRLVLLVALAVALAACHHEAPTIHPTSADLPPLPPASGTPVGYIIDASVDLQLTASQLKQLKAIDASLAARDAGIDTQLRQIETPMEDEDEGGKHHESARPPNHAPGVGIHTNADAAKLHRMRNANDREALEKAFALLDPAQRDRAAKLLEAHDVTVPGAPKKPDSTASQDGKPLPPEA
jgi:hypothetical protein